jgi:hypothetical protein
MFTPFTSIIFKKLKLEVIVQGLAWIIRWTVPDNLLFKIDVNGVNINRNKKEC